MKSIKPVFRDLLTFTLLSLLVAGVQAQAVTVANNPMEVEVEAYLPRIQLPPGFEISLYATGVDKARSMAVGDNGIVYVGSRGNLDGQPVGKVYAVVDEDGDMRADTVFTLAENLETPNGVALHQGDLYIAEISRILRLPQVADTLDNPPEPEVVTDTYPTATHHGWKFIKFGPDGKLYVPVGAPCNTCEREAPFATITRIDPDGSNMEIYASGVRNSVGFDWHPQTGELWFTENGRDLMGDTIPPDELNRASQSGQHFGFPYRYGSDIVDTAYESPMEAGEFTAPAHAFPAHVAPLGIRFYTGDAFPQAFRGDAFVALHGSWNRSPPAGYRVQRVQVEGSEVTGSEPFAAGWLLEDERYWGRPVDVAQMPDGSLLVSDDHNGVIYRIHYTGE